MESILKPALSLLIKTYCPLAKPRIILGNVITAAGGFFLAARGQISLPLLFSMLIGISFVIGSACVFNNYIDREHDRKMHRTKNRALATGEVHTLRTLFHAALMVCLGLLTLYVFTNPLTTTVAAFGFLVYVFAYSFLKYKTVHATLIGSVAGAAPPVIGYCAYANTLDLPALIIFAIITFWQMPHFFAIAIYRFKDYASADVPLLPIKKGTHRTKVQMVIYAILYLAAIAAMPLMHLTTWPFLIINGLIGLRWLYLCFIGFKAKSDPVWARQVFLFSLIVVTALCLTIPFTV